MPPYDANGRLIEPIEPDRNHRLGQQRQEDEDTETAGNPASKYKERPIPSIPLQPSVEAEERGADAYQEKNYRLQKRATSIQFWLCVFTASAFCAAAYYAHVADLQLTASRDSARAAVNSTEAAITQVQVGMMNFMASQRAYLSAGDPRQPLLGRQGPIIIPITNYGHFWVAEPLFAITYVRDSAAAKKLVVTEKKTWHVKTNKHVVLAPGGPAFQLAIAPPPIDAHDALDVESGKQNEFIEVVGMYSPGFNMSPDPLSFCIEYAPSKRLWRDCGHGLYVVDLGKEKPEKPKQ